MSIGSAGAVGGDELHPGNGTAGLASWSDAARRPLLVVTTAAGASAIRTGGRETPGDRRFGVFSV